MKIFLLFFLFLVVCSSCSEPPHVNAAHKIMNSFTRKMEKKGFSLFSSGGAMMYDVEKIILRYQICQSLDIDQARILYIKESEDLLHRINCNKEIKPFLHEYPFTAKNISFTILFLKDDGDFIESPYIATVSMDTQNGRVEYCIDNVKKDILELVYDEPYEEALRIYNETLEMAL